MFLHKYQPQRLDDFDQTSNDIQLMRRLLQTDTLNLLFVGDIGCGKSTYIHAMIREYYAGYEPEQYAENVLYINPLKDQGIHFYRSELKTFAQTYSGVAGKKKIVVLDDLDMIQDQSQHVFRNYIDKYEHNVVFIAACTNQQKVIAALQSQLCIVRLHLLPPPIIRQIACEIITNEHMSLDADAIDFLVNISGSVKVMAHFLEAIYLYDKHMSKVDVMEICTHACFHEFQRYIDLLVSTPPKIVDAVHQMYAIFDNGISVVDILDSFTLFLKHTITISETLKYSIVPAITRSIQMVHSSHEDEIELAMFTNQLVKIIHGTTPSN